MSVTPASTIEWHSVRSMWGYRGLFAICLDAMPAPTPAPTPKPTPTPALVPTVHGGSMSTTVTVAVGLSGIACSEYGEDEESVLVSAMVSTLGSVMSIDSSAFDDTTCSDSRRRRRGLLQTDSVSIALPFSVSSDDYDDDALSPDNIETTVGDTVSSAQSSGALDSTIASEASAAGVTSAIASVSATSVTTSSTTDTDAPNSLTPVPSPPEDTEKGEIPTYLLIAIPVGLLIVCGCCVAMACKSKQASPKASMSPMTQTQQGSAVV